MLQWVHACLLSHLAPCNPRDCSPPVSSVHGIPQGRILEWVAISFSNACKHAQSLQSCLTLCDPMDSIPPGSSVHRILQARVLEWVAISSYRGSSTPRDGLSSVQFSCSVVSDCLRTHESQHARPPCPSPTPRVHSNPCPSSQ